MPDFTVIEGGGEPTRWEQELSQQYLEDFVITLLRTLGGGGSAYRVREQFFRFLEHARENELEIGPIFDGAVRDLNARAFNTEARTDRDAEYKEITQASLSVIAEKMATDGLARARLSKQQVNLRYAVEEKLLGSERRSRESGWSYMKELTHSLGKWPPSGSKPSKPQGKPKWSL
jgi:hypothetical protein